MNRTSRRQEDLIPVNPVCATYWGSEGEASCEVIEDLSDGKGLRRLRAAATNHNTVWLETRLDGLDEKQRTWLEGEYDVWAALPTPAMDWEPAKPALKALCLDAPTPLRTDGDEPQDRLLRALPYAYTRGAFGTTRDAFSEERVAGQLSRLADEGVLTTFPTAGFVPSHTANGDSHYTILHATLGVIGRVVISVRLPDAFCPEAADTRRYVPPQRLVPADVLARFLPLRRMATGREVAEAIGMHQATSARAVASKIRAGLKDAEELAASLNDSEAERRPRQPELRKQVVRAGKTIDELSEVAHQLDRNLATILRRFGREVPHAPWATRELVPPEVERRYRFALDNVRSLHEDCRLASQVVRQEVTVYEHAQRDHFQFIAALIASIVLIPTLLASLFGVNLGIPGEHDSRGFWVFMAVIVAWSVEAYVALKRAQRRGWHLSWPEGLLLFAIAVLLALASVGVALLLF